MAEPCNFSNLAFITEGPSDPHPPPTLSRSHVYPPTVLLWSSDTHPEHEWAAMKGILERLYKEYNLSTSEIKVIAGLVYRFLASCSAYDKTFTLWRRQGEFPRKNNLGLGKVPGPESSTSGQQGSRKAVRGVDTYGSSMFKRFCANFVGVPWPRPLATCRAQEMMLISIDYHMHGLFATNGWGYNYFEIHFNGSDSQRSKREEKAWQDLSDRAFGAGVLLKNSGRKQFWVSINLLFDQAVSAFKTPSPFMLVKFWRICRYFLENGATAGYTDCGLLRALLKFCDGALQMRQKTTGDDHMSKFAGALLRVQDCDMMETLRIGYLMSIHSLQQCVGSDHPVVLSMWSSYFKDWDANGLYQRGISDSYSRILSAAEEHRLFGPRSKLASDLLHGYTYWTYYVMRDLATTVTLATALRERCLNALAIGELTWTSQTFGFTFASKLLVTLYLQQNNRIGAADYYRHTIQILILGDDECLTRALMLQDEFSYI